MASGVEPTIAGVIEARWWRLQVACLGLPVHHALSDIIPRPLAVRRGQVPFCFMQLIRERPPHLSDTKALGWPTAVGLTLLNLAKAEETERESIG